MSVSVVTNVNETSQKTIKLEAVSARKVGDFVQIDVGSTTTGVNKDADLSDNTNVKRVAVCMQDAAVGDVYTACVEGTVKCTITSATVTKGHGLRYHDGDIVTTGSAAGDASGEVGDNLVGIIVEGGASVTSIRATLYGYAVTKTT
jgi:hypothetical protein